MASNDKYRLKVKLPNGNVASRVLPVRIHDLDNEDVKECESILCGIMRGVEFIYKEPGVDKPLAPGDNERKNQNNTVYRIQIIKVAHAVKDIIQGMKAEPAPVAKERIEVTVDLNGADKHDKKDLKGKPPVFKKGRIIAAAAVTVVLLAVAGILYYSGIFKHIRLKKLQAEGKVSVAVVPFRNMTSDTVWNVWQDGVQDILMTSLSNSAEAYRYLIYGMNSFAKVDFVSARSFFEKALATDSNLYAAIVHTAASYGNQGFYDKAKEWCLKAYGKRDLMTPIQKLYSDWQYSNFFETSNEEIRHLKDILRIDDQYTVAYYLLGLAYRDLLQYDKAISEYEKSLEIFKKRGIKPMWVFSYTRLGLAYNKTGEYRKEKRLYKKAEQDFPDDRRLLYRQAVLALSTGKIKDSDKYIEKYRSILIENSASESAMASNIGNIYLEAGIIDKAEEYYRRALSLEPENAGVLNFEDVSLSYS